MAPDSRGRLARIVIAVVVALVLGAGGAWAALTVLRPAEDPLQAEIFTYVDVIEGSVGAEISLNTVAEWKPTPVGNNRATGVVTGISVQAGDEVVQGSVLYSVDLRPVVVAQGEVPAFRDIDAKTMGTDVLQLQQLLADLGFYRNTIDGEAGADTVAAIKHWQKSLGIEQTGVIETADVIFVPILPTHVTLDTEKVFRGATLAGGEMVLRGLPTTPIFTIPVTEPQAAIVPAGTRVEITSPDGTEWLGVIADQTRDAETQTVTVNLDGVEGAAVCGDGCAQVPVTGQTRLASRIITVAYVSGLVVPSAALITTADGQTAVVDQDGSRMIVTVITSARGMSVIEGVPVGTMVQVPGADVGTTE